jgi:ABC-2 type transport system permease protein
MFAVRMLRQVNYSYRGLFGWLRPLDYAIMMFIEPAVQIIFFGLLGRFGPEGTEFYIIGNAVRLMATSALFGATSVIINERGQGTLTAILATPTPVAETFYARALLQGISGVLTGVFCIGLGVLLFDLDISGAPITWLLVGLLVTAISLSGLGLLLANLSLLGTDANLLLNVVFYGLIIFTGANVALADLPGPVATLAHALPMTHGLLAVRQVIDGDLTGLPYLLAMELLIGLAYAAAAVVLLRYAERRARRTGKLELV